MQKIMCLTTTVGTAEQAEQLAKLLVESRLAACVQIDGPIRSIYRWHGTVCSESEHRLTCKTAPALREALMELARSGHPYELPELVLTECDSSSEYAQWLSQQVRADDCS
ncbi:MAG: divalent-cation tolerance protein CutA [Pirellulaceae bacterium]|nr:divalent-cation tolerance protein CutA [Pirellulaceae bacterium]